ncbi:chemotaxis response regulator protein-glutamate methylesterase [uncultured Paraglaciecola sp.]|uniref:protein-glutamate methylesterase/protein-glutamine glutaminase n=1 Tax=uncultured Paraglaciecola sp. TaxID=1765024 RepID=UPI0030D9B76F|tara:strand:- start:32565 stop:33677 length:1113 start_codon:yes stop_codon:yes gene_type:complete
MTYRILIVDDSTFFRRRIKQILEEDAELEVVGEAKNGEEALTLVASLKPDVVTMDIEMPVMDGITAVKKIMASNPVPIIMFSSLTQEGALATLNALDAGALDFLPKKFEDIALNRKEAILLLQNRVKALCGRKVFGSHFLSRTRSEAFNSANTLPTHNVNRIGSTASRKTNLGASHLSRYECLAIGTSTGGPVALQKILTELPSDFPIPVVLVQHMPGSFTQAFAKRLDDLCDVTIKEAANGDYLKPGVCYLAPGGKQMTFEGRAGHVKIVISEPERFPDITYKPSVDVTFESVAEVYSGNVLAIILTGMGADGREGCKKLKANGAKIWAQDEQSCVVYGMPQAVTVANISQANYDIAHMAGHIINEIVG